MRGSASSSRHVQKDLEQIMATLPNKTIRPEHGVESCCMHGDKVLGPDRQECGEGG